MIQLPMPGTLASYISPTVAFGLLGIPVGVVLWVGIRMWMHSRITPDELERRRRAAVNATGKMGDANLVDIQEHLIFYSYDVRGVEYMASQDISALMSLLPDNPQALVGPLFVKYDPKNPANSIILSEDWSGLRARHHQA